LNNFGVRQQKISPVKAYRRCWWTLFRNSKSGKRRRERRERRERKGERKGRKERKKEGIQKPIELRFRELI
jgi:predicted transposase YdaD